MTQNGLSVYDFDHTIYNGDASADFIFYAIKQDIRLLRYVPMMSLALFVLVFRLKSRKAVKQDAFSFLKGVRNVDAMLEGFWATHENKVADWYKKQQEANDIIISASPDFLLAPIAEKLGVGTLIATTMNSRTGVIEGENCRGEEKLRRLDAYDSSLIIDRAYSDSLSDAPLLERASHGYIVRRGTIMPFERRSQKAES